MQLRDKGTPLSPDKIHHALAGVHTIFFEDTSANKLGKMHSMLTVEAKRHLSSAGLAHRASYDNRSLLLCLIFKT